MVEAFKVPKVVLSTNLRMASVSNENEKTTTEVVKAPSSVLQDSLAIVASVMAKESFEHPIKVVTSVVVKVSFTKPVVEIPNLEIVVVHDISSVDVLGAKVEVVLVDFLQNYDVEVVYENEEDLKTSKRSMVAIYQMHCKVYGEKRLKYDR